MTSTEIPTATEQIAAAAKTAGLVLFPIGPYSTELRTWQYGITVGSFHVTGAGRFYGGFLRDDVRHLTTEFFSARTFADAVVAR